MSFRLALLFLSSVVFAQTDAPQPPVAPRVEHREVRQGATVIDHYFWLREKSNPETVKYLDAENAYTAAMTKPLVPFQETLYKEMLGRIKQTDLSVPYRDSGYYYYLRTEEGKQYPIRCRKKGSLDGPEEVLLDQNEMAKGLKFLAVADVEVSDDGNLLAYTTDTTGFRQYTLHVKDLRTGTLLPDTAERVTSLAWAADNKTIFFATEDAVTKRPNLIFRHELGTSPNDEVFHEKDELFAAGVARSRDKKMIFSASFATDSREFRYLHADHPEGNFVVVLPREKGHKYMVDHREGLFYITTNKNAKNYRIVTAPVSNPGPANWKEFVPTSPGVLIQNVDLFQDYAVLFEKSAALNRIRVMTFATGAWKTLAFPEPVYSADPSANPEYDTNLFRYT